MRHRFLPGFERAYAAAPEAVRRAFDRKLTLLLENWRHPSLQAHPWPADGPDAMQARVNLSWRFHYLLDGDTFVIYRLRAHPKSPKRGR